MLKRTGEFRAEIGRDGIESKYGWIGFTQVDGGVARGKQDGDSIRAGEAGDSRCGDFPVVEDHAIGRAEPKPELFVGLKLAFQDDAGDSLGKRGDLPPVLCAFDLADDCQNGVRRFAFPEFNEFLDPLVRSKKAEDETDFMVAVEAELLSRGLLPQGFPVKWREVAVGDDHAFFRPTG